MERNWKLGDDLIPADNLLDPITFDELITTVRCNCKRIDAISVRRQLKEIYQMRLDDMTDLLRRNMDEIIRLASAGREGGD